MSSRQEGYTTTVDNLYLTFINPIPEDNHYAGGIKDFGKFDEGFCFKVSGKIPTDQFVMSEQTPSPDIGKDRKWVFCVDSEDEKNKFMNVFIQLKLKQQHEKGIYLETEKEIERKKVENTASQYKQDVEIKNPENGLDGYWVKMQDWSQCTLACGGGLQYLQMICIPPKTGGKPCEGQPIRTRPCNQQACPTTIQVSRKQEVVNKDSLQSGSSLPVITKMMPVSSRPQRYDKCFIKEADALMELDDKTTQAMISKPRVPVRLVLNDRTITSYQNDELTSSYGSFNINETDIIRLSNEKTCFKLRNKIKEMMLCKLDSSNADDFVEEWDYDLNLFKNQCKTKRERTNNFLPEQKKLEEEFNKKMNSLKVEMVAEKTEVIKKKSEEEEEVQLGKKVDDAQTTSMLAIQKETKLEELLEKEEAAKEDEETNLMESQLVQEQKKEECLLKSIKEKELENQMNLAKSKAEENVAKIQDETKKTIAIQRLNIKKRILEMRKKKERKQAQIRTQIQAIRAEIAEKLNVAGKNGNQDICTLQNLEEARDKYCGENFSSDYVRYSDCKDESQFCYVCCENEFGDLNLIERDKCYSTCDKLNKK
jgi:hypothetical protein